MRIVAGIAVGFGVLFLVAGGLLPLGIGLRSIWRGILSSRWPWTSAVVEKAEVVEAEASRREGTYVLDTFTFYSPKVTFRYQVKGRDYTTQNLQFGRAQGSADASEAALMMLRYPVGAKAVVYYRPSDPSLAVVRPGVHSDVAWYLIAGLAFILFGAVAGLAYLSMGNEAARLNHTMGWLWLIFIFFGIGMLVPGVLNLRHAKASETWPTVEAVVVFSGEGTNEATRGVPLAYEYEVNGLKHYSTVRHFGQFAESGRSWAAAVLSRYPSGTKVPVNYCPDDPDLAALEPGVDPEAWFLPGGGAAFLLFGLAALFMSLR